MPPRTMGSRSLAEVSERLTFLFDAAGDAESAGVQRVVVRMLFDPRFRDAVYEIDVKNPDHVNRGVRALKVDGKTLTGQVIPVFADGKSHRVEVVLGSPTARV